MPNLAQPIAQALAGIPQQPSPVMWEPGLAQPDIDPIMLMTGALGPGAVRGMAGAARGMAQTAPRMMASEAGAIFPEGMAVPANKALAKEMGDVLTESQLNYRRNEALANWHASNYDWPRVLQDKWAMLKQSGGS